MSLSKDSKLTAGKVLGIRLPKNTSEPQIDYLNHLKDSKAISDFLLQKVAEDLNPNIIKVTLEQPLTKEQKEWFNQPYTQKILSRIITQIIETPESLINLNSPITDQSNIEQKETAIEDNSIKINNYTRTLARNFLSDIE
ncbi:MAG: hypothetical protein ACH0QD_04565 [Tepidibacillus sp.]